MKPYSNVKIICRSGIPVSVYLRNWGKLDRLGPNSPYYSTDTQKVIHNVKLLISHQMKPYSSVKGHLRMNLYFFVCICGIGASWQNLVQLLRFVGRDKQKSSKVLKYTFHVKWSLTSRVKTIWGLSYTCFSIFRELGKVGKIGPNYITSWTLIHRESFKVLNITFYIKWSLNQG